MANITINKPSFTNFLHYTYNWGAAVVVLGALFKLTHLPFADILLYIGMGTEVFVFLIAGFDKPHKSNVNGLSEIYSLLDNFIKKYEQNVSAYMNAVQNNHDNNIPLDAERGYYFQPSHPSNNINAKFNELVDNKEVDEIINTVSIINRTCKLELDELLLTLEKSKQVNRETQEIAYTLEKLNLIYRKVADAMKA